MLISLDYDGTYSADPGLWDQFIALAQARGHEVVCVTARGPDQPVKVPIEVIYACGKAKEEVMFDLKRDPQIWIDDQPEFILRDL